MSARTYNANCEALNQMLMAEEKKTDAEVEEPKEPQEAEEPKEPEEPTEPKEPEVVPSEVDYEAELKAERERGFKEGAAYAAFKDRKEKREKKEGEEPPEEDEDDKPLTRREAFEIFEKERHAIHTETLQSIISEKARKLASSDAEAQYIIELHKNRIFPASLSLDEQLEECYGIANRKKLLAKIDEQNRVILHKDTIQTNPADTHKEAPKAGEPPASADISAIKAAGMVWDGMKRIYKKPLARGKFLCYDPNSKKRWVE